MANNKTLRRQAAAARAAESTDAATDEVTGDVLDSQAEEQVPGSGVDDQAAGLVEGDRPDEVLSEGSEAPEVISEQPETLVIEEDLATRDGLTVSDRGLGEIVPAPVLDVAERLAALTAKDMFEGADDAKETPVSEEEQAASTAALLAQEPVAEPDAPATLSRTAAALLAPYAADTPQPVINMEVGGQIGYMAPGAALGVIDQALADAAVPALEESAEDEQAALAEPEVDPANSDPLYVAPTPEPEVESFASTTTEPDLKLDLVEAEPAEADYTTWSTAALRNTLAPAVGKDQSEAWSRDEMLMYLIKGLYPQKTARGNWVYDSRRAGRVKSWSASEISDFIDGKLKLDQHVDVSTVWEEAFARYKIPPNWTIEAFVQYVCNGSTPEYSATGLLLNDRYRDAKRVHHLTYREIRGALLGEIQTKFTPEELMTQYRNRLGIGKSYSTERLLAEMPNQPNEVSMDNSVLRAKLDEYKTGITKNPGTQTEETAGACQGMLYKAIRDVIKRDFNEFVEGWNIILDFVNENYTTLFDPYKARRGWSQVALGKAQLTLFEDLLTVIVATREPGNRAKKQTYNLEIVLRHLPEENQRQNLFMYYAQ
jgi:hypothetical protein